MKTLQFRNSINWSASRSGFILTLLALACLALPLAAQAGGIYCYQGCDDFSQNTYFGYLALEQEPHTPNNTAFGYLTLNSHTTGQSNTAIGHNALANHLIGSSNIALGKGAGVFLTTGSNNIDIGSAGVAAESNTIRIGSAQTRTFIKGISGVALAGATVVVNAGGQLGVAASSTHFKQEIRSMDQESEAVLALKPVTFRYKKELDADRTPQFGLVAEEVAKVNPDLVIRDADGKVYSVRYEAVNAMLLNEFLKEHRKNEKQEAAIGGLKSEIATLSATVKEQASQIHKVTAQLELTKPVPRVVDNQ